MSVFENRRILLIDELASLHEDFREILAPLDAAAPEDLSADERGRGVRLAGPRIAS
jgi:hypothetical protein